MIMPAVATWKWNKGISSYFSVGGWSPLTGTLGAIGGDLGLTKLVTYLEPTLEIQPGQPSADIQVAALLSSAIAGQHLGRFVGEGAHSLIFTGADKYFTRDSLTRQFCEGVESDDGFGCKVDFSEDMLSWNFWNQPGEEVRFGWTKDKPLRFYDLNCEVRKILPMEYALDCQSFDISNIMPLPAEKS